MVCQTPKALNLTHDTLNNEHLQRKLFRQKGLLHDTAQLPVPLRRMKRQAMERWERERSKARFCLLAFLFVCYVGWLVGLV